MASTVVRLYANKEKGPSTMAILKGLLVISGAGKEIPSGAAALLLPVSSPFPGRAFANPGILSILYISL